MRIDSKSLRESLKICSKSLQKGLYTEGCQKFLFLPAGIVVIGKDSETEVQFPLGVSKPYSVDLRILKLLEALPDGSIEIERSGGVLCIETDTNKYEIPVSDEEHSQYPDESEEKIELVLDADKSLALAESLGSIYSASARDESSSVLSGVLMEWKGSKLTISATDGKQMAFTTLESDGNRQKRILLPIGRVIPLISLLKEAGVAMKIGSSILEVKSQEFTHKMRLLMEASYPKMGQVIESLIESITSYGKIRTDEIVKAIKRLQIVSNLKNSETKKISLSLVEEALWISDLTGKEFISCQNSVSVEHVKIACNADILKECFNSFPDKEVEIGFNQSKQLIVMKGKRSVRILVGFSEV